MKIWNIEKIFPKLRSVISGVSIMEKFKRVNPSAERNRDPILQVLKSNLSSDSELKCLEIASGSGTHVGYFAQHLPNILWQPSDYEEENLPSLRAYKSEQENILDPLIIDVSKSIELNNFHPDFMLCINMIHISPWECTLGLLANAGQMLKTGGKLITYGPYKVNGVLEPESNRSFDRSLQGMNFLWGIRDIKDIETEAAREGLEMTNIIEMPANNKMLILEKK